jgi:hypothetical protein
VGIKRNGRNEKKQLLLQGVNDQLDNEDYIVRHRTACTNFIRMRVLSFRVLVVLMLAKGSASLQLRMNHFIPRLGLGPLTVHKSAYSRARRKLKHTAFIELNQIAVVQTMYEDGDYETYKGFRLLAVDGSKIRLPEDDEAVMREFGSMSYANGRPGVTGEHAMALSSVCYDVLNRIALDAVLLPCHTDEVSAAIMHLRTHQWDPNTVVTGLSFGPTDLFVQDRGYHSYRMMASLVQTGAQFVIRCKRQSGMKTVDTMLAGQGPDEVMERITIPSHLAKRDEYQRLPTSLTVRFVRIILANGTIEVLATSVTNAARLTVDELKELYHLRWGIETFYGILKTRLSLENFSGYSPEAIQQDFFATVLLTGVESILIEDAEDILANQKGGQRKKVNKAVSFNLMREQAFELFYNRSEPDEKRLEQLTQLFLMSPTVVRNDRNPPRKRHPDNKVLDWYRRYRKTL